MFLTHCLGNSIGTGSKTEQTRKYFYSHDLAVCTKPNTVTDQLYMVISLMRRMDILYICSETYLLQQRDFVEVRPQHLGPLDVIGSV